MMINPLTGELIMESQANPIWDPSGPPPQEPGADIPFVPPAQPATALQQPARPAFTAPTSDPMRTLRDEGAVDPGQADRLKALIGALPNTQTSTTVERKKPLQNEAKDFADLTGSIDEQKNNVYDAGNIAIAKAQDQQAFNEKQYADAQAEAAQRQADLERAKQTTAKAQSYLDQRLADYSKNGTVRDMFEGNDGARVAAAIFVAVGSYASSLDHGPNTAFEVIKNAQDNFYRKEVARVEQSKELLSYAERDRDKARVLAQVELKNYQAAQLEVSQKELAKTLGAYGADEAQVSNNTLMQKLDIEKKKLIVERDEGLRSAISSHTSPNPIKEQLKMGAMLGGNQTRDLPDEKLTDQMRNAQAKTSEAFDAYKELKRMPQYTPADVAAINRHELEVEKSYHNVGLVDLQRALSSIKGTVIEGLSPDGKRRALEEQKFVEATIRARGTDKVDMDELVGRWNEIRVMKGMDEQASSEVERRKLSYLSGGALQTGKPTYWSTRFQNEIGAANQRPPKEDVNRLWDIFRRNPGSEQSQKALEALRNSMGASQFGQ